MCPPSTFSHGSSPKASSSPGSAILVLVRVDELVVQVEELVRVVVVSVVVVPVRVVRVTVELVRVVEVMEEVVVDGGSYLRQKLFGTAALEVTSFVHTSH
mmetsp:Transcript_1478/g.3485  ORF Transcript_1478/g.3485 Transcript_1478/m.3485 type:complete len:100 (+) Transcript_1478:1124-1423(+)